VGLARLGRTAQKGATMKRRVAAQEQKYVDDAWLLRAWHKWHRKERECALAGPHGAMIERLMFILDSLSR
jgi:hypothetical protein